METNRNQAKLKLTETMHQTAKLEVAKQFLTNIGERLTQRIGNTNMGEEVKIPPESISISPEGKYQCQLQFGNNSQPRDLIVNPDGTVQMTDMYHISGDTISCKASELAITLPGIQDLEQTALQFCNTDSELPKLIDQSLTSPNPISEFQ